MASYPIELDLTGKRVLVVGLGPVGRRKATGLVEAGAEVIGVDPFATPLDGVKTYVERYRPEHLEGMALIFATATAEINRQVVSDARGRRIWVNAASEPELGDFTLPATWRDGPITLTVSTSGASPALAAILRDRAGNAIGPEAAPFAQLLLELRPILLANVVEPERRRQIALIWADQNWLDFWREHGTEAVRTALLRAIEE